MQHESPEYTALFLCGYWESYRMDISIRWAHIKSKAVGSLVTSKFIFIAFDH